MEKIQSIDLVGQMEELRLAMEHSVDLARISFARLQSANKDSAEFLRLTKDFEAAEAESLAAVKAFEVFCNEHKHSLQPRFSDEEYERYSELPWDFERCE